MTDFEKAGSVGFMVLAVVVLIGTLVLAWWTVDGLILAMGGYQ
jgi:hypothetical protein